MKNIVLLILVFFFTSCYFNNYKVEFEIINNTEFAIDSLKILPNSDKSLNYMSLKPHQKRSYVIDMFNVPAIDGSYNLKFKLNDEFVDENYGYYSNGTPLDEYIVVTIEKDKVTFISKDK